MSLLRRICDELGYRVFGHRWSLGFTMVAKDAKQEPMELVLFVLSETMEGFHGPCCGRLALYVFPTDGRGWIGFWLAVGSWFGHGKRVSSRNEMFV